MLREHLGDTVLGSHAVGFLVILTLGAPVLVGLFWGAPLVAAEAEAGTGSSPGRRASPAGTGCGQDRLDAAGRGDLGRRDLGPGDLVVGAEQRRAAQCVRPRPVRPQGIVPVAYSVFALALGIAAGALLRRTLPAIAVTLAGFIGVRVVVTLWLRPHYLSAVTVFYKVTSGFTPPGAYWRLGSGIVGPNGQAIDAEHERECDRRHPRHLPPGFVYGAEQG